jgi:hypothetical protein
MRSNKIDVSFPAGPHSCFILRFFTNYNYEQEGGVCSLYKLQLWTEPAVNGAHEHTHTAARVVNVRGMRLERDRQASRQKAGDVSTGRRGQLEGQTGGLTRSSGQRGPDKAGQVHWPGVPYPNMLVWCKALSAASLAPLANHDSYPYVLLPTSWIVDGYDGRAYAWLVRICVTRNQTSNYRSACS